MVVTSEKRQSIVIRDGNECQNCGKEVCLHQRPKAHVHHIEPKSEGGSDHESNLTTLCVDCHDEEHGHGIGRTSGVITVISRTSGKEIELNDTEVNILDELKDGRNTPTGLACMVDISQGYASERLKRLEEHGLVEKVHTGLYELVSDPRDEEGD